MTVLQVTRNHHTIEQHRPAAAATAAHVTLRLLVISCHSNLRTWLIALLLTIQTWQPSVFPTFRTITSLSVGCAQNNTDASWQTGLWVTCIVSVVQLNKCMLHNTKQRSCCGACLQSAHKSGVDVHARCKAWLSTPDNDCTGQELLAGRHAVLKLLYHAYLKSFSSLVSTATRAHAALVACFWLRFQQPLNMPTFRIKMWCSAGHTCCTAACTFLHSRLAGAEILHQSLTSPLDDAIYTHCLQIYTYNWIWFAAVTDPLRL